MDTLYSILNQDAKCWWYHRQLREQGNCLEARQRERKSILEHVEVLRYAVFANVGRGGWSISFIGQHQKSKDHLSRLEGYGGMESSMIQACLLAGIPVCNSLTIPDEEILEVIRFPMPAHPDVTPEKAEYGSFDYAPYPVVFKMYEKLGAELYNA